MLESDAFRRAAMSVYHYSVGRQMRLQGAAAVLLPPEMRPLPLGEALRQLQELDPHSGLRDAVWRLVHAAPLGRLGNEKYEYVYPPELRALKDLDEGLRNFHRLRLEYRAGAPLFAAALIALGKDNRDEARDLSDMLDDSRVSAATKRIFGIDAPTLLSNMTDGDRKNYAHKELVRLETEVGLNLYEFVEDFVDAAAFIDSGMFPGPPNDGRGITVYPASSVIRQDADSLTTTAIVTTVARGDFRTLARSVDPQCWPLASSVIRMARYVDGRFSLNPLPEGKRPEPGYGWCQCGRHEAGDDQLLLEERAHITWGDTVTQRGSFHNVLGTVFEVDPPRLSRGKQSTGIDLRYWLVRSISSQLLWDDRLGGIVLNEGYIKVRPLMAADYWRVTIKKVLRFSDRTPNANSYGWMDSGQAANYLAPAALTWWLESEMYSAETKIYSDKDEVLTKVRENYEKAQRNNAENL
ncbi:hypothetical protein [Kribbella sp. NBC_00359]|uniref:hypothetical protein n=1 Tax=Kribbella sp. NBC_00359 TaxID=2975966 RepID=UPI002E2132E0